MSDIALVSVIVPCRNEYNYIADFVSGALSQICEGWALELIIADGQSDDGTRDRLRQLAATESRLRWIDNPGRIVSTGLNLAIEEASGDIVVRMDVHTRYENDYIKECVRALQSTGAMCVGGPWVAEGHTPTQRAVAAAFQSRIGSGGAASRRRGFSGWVDTVYLGAWWRADLVTVGGFDETLVRNQDDELCLRIHRRGGRIWQSSAIRSVYVPRDSFAMLYRQFNQYGYWKIAVIRKHRLPASLRHVAPFAFLACLTAMAILSPVLRPAGWALCTLMGLYLVAIVLGTRAQRGKAGLNLWGSGALTILAVVIMHFGYALGFGRAIWDFFVCRQSAREAMAQLTR